MQTRQEDDACMHDFIFSKQNTYSFQKVFDLSNFSKILKSWDVTVARRTKGDSEPHLPKGRDGAAGDPGEGLGGHDPIIWNLEHLEGVDGDDNQACAPINERFDDSNVVDGGGAHQRESADSLGGPRMVLGVESDGVL